MKIKLNPKKIFFKKLFFIFTTFIIFNNFSILNIFCFQSISQAQNYASKVPEFPLHSNSNIINSNYLSFYKKMVPTLWQKTLSIFSLNPKFWSPQDFKDSLKKITDYRLEKFQISRTEQLLTVNPNSQIFIWSSLHGAYHSLVRCLTYLVNEKIMDSQFKILDPNTYFIFNGNTIDFGPYSMEILTLIFNLINTNPDKVFYIRGSHEDKDRWHNYNFATQLKVLAQNLSPLFKELIPLNNLVNDLFDTLPLETFVNIKDTNSLFSVSSLSLSEPTEPTKSTKSVKAHINSKLLNNYNTNTSNNNGLYRLNNINNTTVWSNFSSPVQLYRLKNNFFYDAFVKIKLGSNLEKSTIQALFHEYLKYSKIKENFKTGPVYNLVSGETLKKGQSSKAHLPVIKLDNLNNINFTKEQLLTKIKYLNNKVDLLENKINSLKESLKTNKSNSQSINTNTNTNTNTSFKKGKNLINSYIYTVGNFNNLVYEVEKTEKKLLKKNILNLKEYKEHNKQKRLNFYGEHAQEKSIITLGSSAALSKSFKTEGTSMKIGISLKVNQLNIKGVENKFIKLVFLDDEQAPLLFRENLEKILKTYKSNLIIFPGGTSTLKYALDFIKSNNMFIFFPQSGSLIFRDANLKNIVNFRASFEDEGRALVDYTLKNYSPKNFLFFYQNDELGKNTLKGATKILEKNSINNWTETAYEPTSINFQNLVSKIKEVDPDIIGFFSTGPAALQLMRDLGIEFLANKILFGSSSMGNKATLKVFKDKGLKLIVSEPVPDPNLSELEIVKNYRNQLKKHGLSPNVFSLEGYIVTSILLDQILKSNLVTSNLVTGNLITGEKIMAQIESIKNQNFQGLRLNFDAKSRSVGESIWIKTVDNKFIEKSIKTLKEYHETVLAANNS